MWKNFLFLVKIFIFIASVTMENVSNMKRLLDESTYNTKNRPMVTNIILCNRGMAQAMKNCADRASNVLECSSFKIIFCC